MTLRGLLVIVVELLLVVLAFGTEFRNFLVLALCIGGLLAYSFVSLLLASLTLGAKTEIDRKTALRTETVKYTFSVRGVALLPVASYFFVKTTDTKVKQRRKFRHSFLLLPSFSVKREFVFEIPCAHVGEWKIGVRKIRIEDLFGFFSVPLIWCKKSALLKKITVMPNIYNLSEDDARSSVGGFGSTNLLNSENGELMGDSRLYREGDTFRRINWKMSTRTKKLYSRMFETPHESTVAIVMDTAAFGEFKKDIVDISCETAISLAEYFVKQNIAAKIVFARCKDGSNIKVFEVDDHEGVVKIQKGLTDTLFHKEKEALPVSLFEGMQILNSNRIYFISHNPSNELVSILGDMNDMGKVAYCMVPCASLLGNDLTSVVNAARVDIASADQIIEKVGGAL